MTQPNPRPAARGRRGTVSRKPSLRVERDLQRQGYRLVAGMDEVGRGALAGPVSVGVCVVDESCRSAPVGLRDSKLLAARRREELVSPVRRWALAYGVGHASPREIDEFGIMAALRLAGRRALLAAGVRPDVIVLDGNHDWLTDPRREGLFALLDETGDSGAPDDPDDPQTSEPGAAPAAQPPVDGWPRAEVRWGVGEFSELPALVPPVRTLIKGDMRCSSVAAASVLAKVERDARMVSLADSHPDYGWHINKGYAAPEHRAALLRLGACDLHRRSWNLLAAPPAAQPGPVGGQVVTEPGPGDLDGAAAALLPESERMSDDGLRYATVAGGPADGATADGLDDVEVRRA